MIRDLQIHMPDTVKDILNKLKSHGYEAYIVGGCVRDALLGRIPTDWDITTSALPFEVKSLFHNTVDTGIQHGTVMVILNGTGYEITTYRVDGEYRDGRHPESVKFTRSLEEDLKRRDFTINAMAWDEDGAVDLFGGIKDLEHGIIRCVGNPSDRFSEDALRIMRAIRFSAQLGFSIEDETRRQIVLNAGGLSQVSMERIRVEWEKTLISDHPEVVNLYKELGMASYILGDYSKNCFNSRQNAIYYELNRRRKADSNHDNVMYRQDIIKKALKSEDLSQFYRKLMMAAFFEGLSAKETSAVFRRLKYDNKTKDSVTSIIKYAKIEVEPNKIQIKQLLHKIGLETVISVLELRDVSYAQATCDGNDTLMEYRAKEEKGQQMLCLVEEILDSDEAWNLSQLKVTGRDLMEAGVPSGKILGEVLEKILQKVIQSPTLNSKEQLCNSEFLGEVQNECKGNL